MAKTKASTKLFTCDRVKRYLCYLQAALLAVATAFAPQPVAAAQPDRAATPFWKAVQASCDATAARPPGMLGQRIAQTAITEFARFGGHQIDSNGRLFHFGLTEAEQEDNSSDGRPARLGHLAWWQVLKYWRALYGNDAADGLEIRGYHDASNSDQEKQTAGALRANAARLLRAAEETPDPMAREILREAIFRAAIIDTSWSAAFISYVVRQSGAPPNEFRYANAHRVYIYDAFATSAAEVAHRATEGLYRACPLTATRPRLGDLICQQREPALIAATETDTRERIRADLDRAADVRSVQQTHCEVVAHIDVQARKVYTIGGNANQSVAARKMNLRGRGLKFSATQGDHCRPGQWSLPLPLEKALRAGEAGKSCSLNDRKWFVLLQLR